MGVPSVYLETSVLSYLAARPARDLITAARQQVTRDWWATNRVRFALYVSQVVLDEAAATVHGMDYLLTWNLRHIANAEQRPLIERACRSAGYRPPVICTPDELMGGS